MFVYLFFLLSAGTINTWSVALAHFILYSLGKEPVCMAELSLVETFLAFIVLGLDYGEERGWGIE